MCFLAYLCSRYTKLHSIIIRPRPHGSESGDPFTLFDVASCKKALIMPPFRHPMALQRSSGGKTLRPGDTGRRFEVRLPGQAADLRESIVVHRIANTAEVVDVNEKTAASTPAAAMVHQSSTTCDVAMNSNMRIQKCAYWHVRMQMHVDMQYWHRGIRSNEFAGAAALEEEEGDAWRSPSQL